MSPRERKQPGLLVDLPPDLDIDLQAFCAAHFDAPKAGIVRRAVRAFIDAELAAEPRTRRRFDEARAQLVRNTGISLRLVDGEPKEKTS